ncbi:N-methyl-L-tryptophan oxidase [Gryllotalpicola ginsengisoli]|uniref:N-methyl-L-tryptophan oxidase n=1 Tax=Gryllotalpicola ginsengisoli TaxID=444608 RepID=UPI0003B564A4|nr:N-methyl-L-tryptophan oxidase [Gryllotalpicola ginsengisoli]
MGFDAEVGVVGVGTMGSQALWQLAQRGVSAIGFEQFAPGHDRAGAGGESRLFRTAYFESSRYVPLLRLSKLLWRRLEAATETSLLHVNGALMIGEEGGDFLARVQRSIDEHGIDHEVLDAQEMQRRYPQHRISAGQAAILDRESGFLRPELAVASAARAGESLGARIRRRSRVDEIRFEDDAVTVLADGELFRFRRLIVAAGAWTSQLLLGLAPLTEVVRIAMTWWQAKQPAAYTEDVFPVFARVTDGYDISGWPSLDAATVKVGLNNGWDRVGDPDALDRTVPDALFEEIRNAVGELMPGLIPEPVRIGVYMDGYTADHDPYVGPLQWDPRVTVLGGFSGHGFKMAPAIGLAAADYATENGTELPIGFLHPNRFVTNVTAADRMRFRRTAAA